jgi:hypothetical protein
MRLCPGRQRAQLAARGRTQRSQIAPAIRRSRQLTLVTAAQQAAGGNCGLLRSLPTIHCWSRMHSSLQEQDPQLQEVQQSKNQRISSLSSSGSSTPSSMSPTFHTGRIGREFKCCLVNAALTLACKPTGFSTPCLIPVQLQHALDKSGPL